MTDFTLDDIRRQLVGRGFHRAECLPLVDAIEARAAQFPDYAEAVEQWLSADPRYSTVHLRDVLCDPLRYDPQIVEIGKQFNPTTEWDNTWIPLDTALHRARHGIDPDVWL